MKISVLSVGLLALLTPLTAAWTKEDREIFRLRDEIATYEGPDVTFYDFLGITPGASQDDINKAYRKKSKSLHPDKVKAQLTADRAKGNKKPKDKTKNRDKTKKSGGVHVSKGPSQSEIKAAVKAASERQARLSIVAEILRGAGRERYDYFLANGFPVWKGTEYYYNRYRPGLGTALFGVFIFGGGAAHYLALWMGWRRQREFVERYIKFARHAAWGENLGINIPGVDDTPAPAAAPPPAEEAAAAQPVNRKMRRLQEKEAKREAAKEGSGRRARGGAGRRGGSRSGSATPQPPSQSGPTGAKKRVVAENGKVLVVDSLGDVYLEEEDEDGKVEEFLLDPNEIPRPTFKDTALYRLPVWLYGKSVGRVLAKSASEADDSAEEDDGEEGPAADEEDSEPGKHTPSTDSAEEFEMLEKSVDELGKAKASGSQKQSAGGRKRKGKKK